MEAPLNRFKSLYIECCEKPSQDESSQQCARLQGMTLLAAEAARSPERYTMNGSLHQLKSWFQLETADLPQNGLSICSAKSVPQSSSLDTCMSCKAILEHIKESSSCLASWDHCDFSDFELAPTPQLLSSSPQLKHTHTQRQRARDPSPVPPSPLEKGFGFASARDVALKQKLAKRTGTYDVPRGGIPGHKNTVNNGGKTLGLKRRAGFQPPRPINGGGNDQQARSVRGRRSDGGWHNGAEGSSRAAVSTSSKAIGDVQVDDDVHPRLKCLDPALVEQIENEILVTGKKIGWNDIAGLEFAKRTCQEIVVLPILCPEMFQGLRKLPKGLLLFGPPGTGKTMIGKAIASQSGATFFSISASSLTSKWIGQGEKLVRALFGVAAARQPSVIFIDEIDSLLSQRSSDENEASRRIKTEFLVQLDGAGCDGDEKILVLGATNRPQELDEAARRRFMKRLYIPLPDKIARKALFRRLLNQNANSLTDDDYAELVVATKGYSGSDLDGLCREAAMAPLRDATEGQDLLSGNGVINFKLKPSDLRPISKRDLLTALRQVRASVGKSELKDYLKWNEEFGSFAVAEEV